MANTFPTPNMNLAIPVVGVDLGPDWAFNVNNNFSFIDQHNHSAGSGVPINPGGLNINSDLTFNGNNAIGLRSLRLNSQASPISAVSPDLGILYQSGVDLYYNDGSGNQVRITQSGGVAGSPGSISNLTSPASASYVSANSTFVWQSAASTPANMDFASAILRNLVANSFGLTLNPPSAMTADFSITLPTLPSVLSYLTIDASGNMGTQNADQIAAAMTTTGVNLIANERTRTTGSTVGIGGVAISASCGSFSTTTGGSVPVTNLSVTITTSGRPVQLMLIDDGSVSGGSYIASIAINIALQTTETLFSLYRGTTQLTNQLLSLSGASSFIFGIYEPSSIINFVDIVGAGTYTYTLQTGNLTANTQSQVLFAKLVAYEL